MTKPNWWPDNPYPDDVFPMTGEGYAEAVPDEHKRTAISGYLGRFFWERASERIHTAMIEAADNRADETVGGKAEVATLESITVVTENLQTVEIDVRKLCLMKDGKHFFYKSDCGDLIIPILNY